MYVFATDCQGNIIKRFSNKQEKFYIKIKYCNVKHVLNREWGGGNVFQSDFPPHTLMQFDIVLCFVWREKVQRCRNTLVSGVDLSGAVGGVNTSSIIF